MTDRATRPTKIDRQLTGPQITVGGRTVQPLARLTGQVREGSGPSGSGAGAWLRLTPVEVMVHDPDGAERRIAVIDPTARILQGMAALAAFIATAGAALILIARLLERRDLEIGGKQYGRTTCCGHRAD
jgi:hypothetical protein